jgi:hypothetical protein
MHTSTKLHYRRSLSLISPFLLVADMMEKFVFSHHTNAICECSSLTANIFIFMTPSGRTLSKNSFLSFSGCSLYVTLGNTNIMTMKRLFKIRTQIGYFNLKRIADIVFPLFGPIFPQFSFFFKDLKNCVQTFCAAHKISIQKHVKF